MRCPHPTTHLHRHEDGYGASTPLLVPTPEESPPSQDLFCLTCILRLGQGISLLIGQFNRNLRPAQNNTPSGIRTIRLGTDRQGSTYLMDRVYIILLYSARSRAFIFAYRLILARSTMGWGVFVLPSDLEVNLQVKYDVVCEMVSKLQLEERNFVLQAEDPRDWISTPSATCT